MALKFGAAISDRVDCGSGTTLDNLLTLTHMALIRPLAASLDCGIISKGSSGAANRRAFELRNFVTANALFGTVDCATTDALSESTANLIHVDRWQTVGMTYDNGTKVIRLFYGTPEAPISEVTYATQTTGNGNTGDNSAVNQVVGAFGVGTSGSLNGLIAIAMAWNRVLSLYEMRQMHPWMEWIGGVSSRRPVATVIPHGCVLNMPLGRGPQVDYSGFRNHGTVTGAVVAAPLPRAVRVTTPRVLATKARVIV